MKRLKDKYEEKYGSIEPYIVLKMQLAVISALIISVIGVIINPILQLLNILTLAMLIHSSYQIKKKFKDKLVKYSLIFGIIYIIAIISPLIIVEYAIPLSPRLMDMIIIVMILLVIAMIVTKIKVNRKGVKAKVLLANREMAVIKPKYDLITGIKPKRYVVDNKGAEKEDEVIVKLSKTPFRKPEPKKIKRIIGKNNRGVENQ